MIQFKVGGYYEAADCGIDPVEIMARTDKTVYVKNQTAEWKMRVKSKIDERSGDVVEYCVDSSVPKKWRGLYEYNAMWEMKK